MPSFMSTELELFTFLMFLVVAAVFVLFGGLGLANRIRLSRLQRKLEEALDETPPRPFGPKPATGGA